MHPLRNGSQATARPAAKPLTGTPGWFTESGDNNVPSYPGADWFNQNIAEFQNALVEMGIVFDPAKDDHLGKIFQLFKSQLLLLSSNNLTFPSVSAMIANSENYEYKVGQLAKIQGENNLTVFYSIVGVESDVNLGSGLYAKRLSVTRDDDIRLFGGSVDLSDNSAAFLSAKAKLGKVFFPDVVDSSTYFFTTLASGDIDGVEIDSDENVILSFATNDYSKFVGGNFINDTKVVFRDINAAFIAKAQDSLTTKQNLPLQTIPRIDKQFAIPFADLVGRQVVWSSSDTFIPAPLTDVNGYQHNITGSAGNFAGAFTDIKVGETITSFIKNTATATNPIGVMIRGSNGFMVIYKTPTLYGDYITADTKLTGVSVTSKQLDFPDRGFLSSFEIQNSQVSITLVNPLEFRLLLNGKDVTRNLGGIGTIFEVGFVSFGNGAGVDINISALYSQQQDYMIGSAPIEEIRIFGDSTAAEFFGSFNRYLPQLIDAQLGIKLLDVNNFAVAGYTLEQCLTSMQTNGFGNARYAVVPVGTNNIQAGQPISAFANIFQTVLNEITSAGVVPVIVEPWMWYPKSANGGNGQETNNYEGGAAHRSFMALATISAGGVFVRTTQELPNPKPSYVGTQADPLLRDNIHQSATGYQLYAQMIANGIISHYVKYGFSNSYVPSKWTPAGINAASSLYKVNKDGSTTFKLTLLFPGALTPGSLVLTLPRWINTNEHNIPVTLLNTTTFEASSGYININGRSVTIQYNKPGDTTLVAEFTV